MKKLNPDQITNILGGLLAGFVAIQPLLKTGVYETLQDWSHIFVAFCIAVLSYNIGKKTKE